MRKDSRGSFLLKKLIQNCIGSTSTQNPQSGGTVGFFHGNFFILTAFPRNPGTHFKDCGMLLGASTQAHHFHQNDKSRFCTTKPTPWGMWETSGYI